LAADKQRGRDAKFSTACRDCARLAAHLDDIRVRYPGYHAGPVAPFGDARSRLLVVGLAPGLHGANRTGRPFTGDAAGVLLFETLHRFGYASQATAVAHDDGMQLTDCRITNAVKCLPPGNRPRPDEVARCNRYLSAEIGALPTGGAILALGRIAHSGVLRALSLPARPYPFAHGAQHVLPVCLTLYDSYHCSRYNTQTRRLTSGMFQDVVRVIARHLPATVPGQARS